MSIRLILADDHAEFRATLKTLLEQQADLEVVACVDDGQALLDYVDCCDLLPDLIVTDISMPRMGGIEAAHRLKNSHPSIRILALSSHNEPQFVIAMRAAGADAYLLKSDSFETLTLTIFRLVRQKVSSGL
jgi:DNA-binding NarL/FixJ family response regulator